MQHFTDRQESYDSLYHQHEKLKADYSAILGQAIVWQATARHYENIKDVVDFKERYKLDQHPTATILVRNLTPEQHYYLVNRGARHGIKKDMVAFYQSHIIGRISDVYDFYSKVILVTDQNSKVAAYTSKTRAPGIVRGNNNLERYNLIYVSHLFPVEGNDLVLSSGQGLIFPEGFCLGKVVFHSLKGKELYHYIEVKPLVNFRTLPSCTLADYASLNSVFASPPIAQPLK